MLTKAKLNKTLFILLSICFMHIGALAQKKSEIDIKNAEHLDYLKNNGNPITIFRNKVHIVHKQVDMFCDSIYQYENENRIDAFGRVHIINADTIHIWGDRLRYDEKTRIAKMRGNVKLQNKNVVLTTEKLDFDLKENIGYYFDRGQIVDSTNTLESVIGRYYTDKNLLFFKDNVEVYNNDYQLDSDTLKYNTTNKTAYILGPTIIETEKETLYSEDGWYNTATGISELIKENRLSNDSYEIKADSIYGDKLKEIAYLYDNIELKDTTNNLILRGNYAETFKSDEKAMITKNTLFIQVSEQDSLFLHADTIRAEKDSAGFELLKTYNRVKFFRKDLQGKCDSLAYSMQDSTIRMFNNPVIWAQGNQITADSISIEMVNKKIRYLHIRGNALLTNKEDSLFFNQIKGKTMLGHVKNNKLYKLDINGNSETLYYPKDKEVITGMNIAKSSNITIKIKDNKIDEILFSKKPDGNMYPLFQIEQEMLFLRDFKWLDKDRPKSKEDIFIWSNHPPMLSKDLIKIELGKKKETEKEINPTKEKQEIKKKVE